MTTKKTRRGENDDDQETKREGGGATRDYVEYQREVAEKDYAGEEVNRTRTATRGRSEEESAMEDEEMNAS